MENGKALTEKLLGNLGITFSKSAIKTLWTVLKNMIKTKSLLKNLDVNTLPRATDPTTGEIMRLLDKLTHIMYHTDDPRLPAVMYKSLNVSLDRGLTDCSPVAFFTAGMILTGLMNDLKGGSLYGDIALKLIEKDQNVSSKSRTLFAVHSFLYPWIVQTRVALQPLVDGYNIGLQTRDIDNACISICMWIGSKFRIGTPLPEVDENCKLYCHQMRELKRDQAPYPTLVQWQLIRNLMDSEDREDPCQLVGETFTEEDFQYFEHHPGFDHYFRGFEIIMCSYVEASDRMLKHGADELVKKNLAVGFNQMNIYLSAVSLFAAAQETGKRKYLQNAEAMRAKIKLWLQRGCPDVSHYDHFWMPNTWFTKASTPKP